MTSRYFRFKAEHVTTTPSCGFVADLREGVKRETAASLRLISQSQRSLSVRGVSEAILALLESE